MATNRQKQGFIRELKRRRVLHTASLYVLGAWIVLQVIEVLAGAGLPPSTMRNVLIALSFGFPVALVVGWFFDISKEGIVKTPSLTAGEQLPPLQFLDQVLLTGLLLVVAMDAYILSFPPPVEDAVVTGSAPQQRTIAVLGFDDLELAEGDDPIGDVFAGEIRSSLTRIAGLRVLGPETSKMLRLAGENRLATAKELLVTALVLGEVMLRGGRISVSARLVGIPAGNELWSSSIEGTVGEAVELQQGLLKQLVGAIAPGLDPDPLQGPRAEAGQCSAVYDIYLRGKQLSKARHQTQAKLYNRGMELLREAVSIDDQCALAWEAIATASVDWTMPGFVKAGAAARRALELNDTLPEAWSVLAEIAEQEERWMDSEEYFMRALYADPTNAHVNKMYSETLIARGRVKEAVHYALEAYRFEPASYIANWRVALAAIYAGDGELAIKHAEISMDVAGKRGPWSLDVLAEGYLLEGETERALEILDGFGDSLPDWYLDCVRIRDDPGLRPGIAATLRELVQQHKSGKIAGSELPAYSIVRCGAWLGEPDLVFYVMFMKGVPPYEDGVPTEVVFLNMFRPDGTVLRQDPRFRKLVVESGLLDYWRKWGWSDYCEADGDSFRCD